MARLQQPFWTPELTDWKIPGVDDSKGETGESLTSGKLFAVFVHP